MVGFLVPAGRRFWRDRTELLIGGGAFAALVVGAVLGSVMQQPVLVSVFRQVTGIPCPLCRGTRAAQSLAVGQPVEAMVWNPLATVLMVAAVGWVVLRVVFARRIAWRLTGRGRAFAWGGAVTAIAANWAYVIAVGG